MSLTTNTEPFDSGVAVSQWQIWAFPTDTQQTGSFTTFTAQQEDSSLCLDCRKAFNCVLARVKTLSTAQLTCAREKVQFCACNQFCLPVRSSHTRGNAIGLTKRRFFFYSLQHFFIVSFQEKLTQSNAQVARLPVVRVAAEDHRACRHQRQSARNEEHS